MNNVIAALDILIALSRLRERMVKAEREVSEMIQDAQSEGRDLTEEELQSVVEKRNDAMDRWNRLTEE